MDCLDQRAAAGKVWVDGGGVGGDWQHLARSEPHASLLDALQTIIYIDFFYYYIRAWKSNTRLKLPA